MIMNKIVLEYSRAVSQNNPAKAGNIVSKLDINDRIVLRDILIKSPSLKRSMVRSLWFDYETQKYF